MTAPAAPRRRRAPDRRAVTAWLRIDCGQLTRRGAVVRPPAADYWCARCGRTESASGAPATVAHFARTVRAAHARTCPARTPAENGDAW